MKLIGILIFSFLLAFNCSAQEKKQATSKFFANDSIYLKEMLQGLWHSEWVERAPSIAFDDAMFHNVYHSTYVYIEGDSLWTLDYPCIKNAVAPLILRNFSLKNDTTLLYSGERYVSVNNYNSGAIAQLKIHETNPNCLIGEWYLARYLSGEDGSGVDYLFPFEIADTLLITEEMIRNKLCLLKVNGIERSFNFTFYTSESVYELILTPTDEWRPKDKVMWVLGWNHPPLNQKELKKLKKGEGIPLVLTFGR